MATLAEVESAFLRADQAGDTEAATALAGEVRRLRAAPAAAPAPAAPEPSLMDRAGQAARDFGAGVVQGTKDLAGGLVRGAGSIGATLLAPGDALFGRDGTNQARRQGMTDALQTLGANPDSLNFGAGKLTTEVAGTVGVGGAIANTAARIPGVAAAAPNALNAIRTGGMSAGPAAPGALAGAQNALVRASGGAVTGGASAGLVDPSQAGLGAAIGGVLPGAVQIAGGAGNAVGRLARGPQQAPDLAQAVTAARGAGYVIPPSQARPTLTNRMLEGFSGKITTAQNASAKNQGVTDRLAAEAIGLPADTKITPEVLKDVRDKAGQAYEAIGSAGTITPGPDYAAALDKISAPHLKAAQGFPDAAPSPVVKLVESLRSPSFDAASAVAKIRELRTAADDAFRTGNTDVARASKSAAKALEDAIEGHLAQTGDEAVLQAFRDARTQIAKTYSVEKALNRETGSIDARKLTALVQRGKPLTGELRQAADFAGRFPKAAQTPERMGSLPGTSPLDWHAGAATSMLTGNPLMMAGVAARPAARSLMFSPIVQDRLIQGQRPNVLQQLLADQDLAQLGYRAAPVASSGR